MSYFFCTCKYFFEVLLCVCLVLKHFCLQTASLEMQLGLECVLPAAQAVLLWDVIAKRCVEMRVVLPLLAASDAQQLQKLLLWMVGSGLQWLGWHISKGCF